MVDLLHSVARATLALFWIVVVAGGVAAGGATAQAVTEHRIIRTVNDAAISSYDIAARLSFVAATAGVAPRGEELERLRGQVLETLIDEQLQLQEAERLGIKVSDEEIQAAIGRIEAQNRMQSGQLVQMLTQRNVDANTLVAQIRAALAWRKVVGQRLRTQVSIGEDEIDTYLSGLQQKGGAEYLLGEIFIAANTPDELPRARETAERLFQELRRGTSFTELARQFSQAPTAGAGGDTGWVAAAQMEVALAEAVQKLQVGQVTQPIGVPDGYYLLALRSKRTFGPDGEQETVYDLRRLLLPYDPRAGEQTVRAALIRATQARQTFSSCEALERYATAAGDPQNGSMGEVRLDELPPGLQPIVENLEVGRPSQVYRLPDAAMVLMLCGKRTRSLGLPSRDEVRENLVQQYADVLARRYLRELRQNAIIQTVQERS